VILFLKNKVIKFDPAEHLFSKRAYVSYGSSIQSGDFLLENRI